MDEFKKQNVKLATKEDYNAKQYVHLRDRAKIGKMLRRYSRRKLKQLDNKGFATIDTVVGFIIIAMAVVIVMGSISFFAAMQAGSNKVFDDALIISNYLADIEWESGAVEHKGIEFEVEHTETDYNTEQLVVSVKDHEFILERMIDLE